MKFYEGKIVELDPKKWYWLVIHPASDVLDRIETITMRNGEIIIGDPSEIEFVENPDRIKGIVIKEFDTPSDEEKKKQFPKDEEFSL